MSSSLLAGRTSHPARVSSRLEVVSSDTGASSPRPMPSGADPTASVSERNQLVGCAFWSGRHPLDEPRVVARDESGPGFAPSTSRKMSPLLVPDTDGQSTKPKVTGSNPVGRVLRKRRKRFGNGEDAVIRRNVCRSGHARFRPPCVEGLSRNYRADPGLRANPGFSISEDCGAQPCPGRDGRRGNA